MRGQFEVRNGAALVSYLKYRVILDAKTVRKTACRVHRCDRDGRAVIDNVTQDEKSPSERTSPGKDYTAKGWVWFSKLKTRHVNILFIRSLQILILIRVQPPLPGMNRIRSCALSYGPIMMPRLHSMVPRLDFYR